MESIDKLFDNFKSKIGTTIGQSEWININQKFNQQLCQFNNGQSIYSH